VIVIYSSTFYPVGKIANMALYFECRINKNTLLDFWRFCHWVSNYVLNSTIITFSILPLEKCPCPNAIRASWMEYAPYTKYDSDHQVHDKLYSSHRGILDSFLEQMIHDVCTECTKVRLTFVMKYLFPTPSVRRN